MGNPYSNLKMARWYAKEGGLPEAPKQVELILSDLCNQDCSFCAYRLDGYTSNELFMGKSEPAKYGHNNPIRMMDWSRTMALVEEIKAAGCLAIQFTGGGEPTVHPKHESIFQLTLDIGLKAALVSNGMKWSERLIEEILHKFSWVRVSIDAGHEETYAKIRNTSPGNFNRVLDNTRQLAAAIEREGSDCVLGVGFVVTKDNWKEIDLGVCAARETGASNIRLSAEFNPDGAKPYRDIYREVKDACERAKGKYQTASFRVHEFFTDRLEDLIDGPPDYDICAHQWYTTYIGADLNLYRCCVYAYNKRGHVAGINLKDVSFKEAWASSARQEDFKKLDPKLCERCQFNDKNRAMAYLLEESVTHEQFP